MALSFDGVDDVLSVTAAAPVTAVPLSIFAWFKKDYDHFADNGVVWIGENGNDSYWAIACQVDDNEVLARTDANTSARAATSTGTPSENVWISALGVFASATSRVAYVNGGSSGSNTNSLTPTNVNSMYIGGEGENPAFMQIEVAEVAVWNVALTAADAADLHSGICPLFVRRDALVSYTSLRGPASAQIDLITGRAWSVTGSPTEVTHPNIFYPRQGLIVPPPAVAAAGQPYIKRVGGTPFMSRHTVAGGARVW